MFSSIFTSVIAYASTNIDDIFVLMILLAQVKGAAKGKLIAGHFLGVGLITVISLLGALGLQQLPTKYIGLLGLVPIFLGIKACFHKDDDSHSTAGAGLAGMALITLGNGADNFGVYIPLFSSFTGLQRLAAAVSFMFLTALWVWLAHSLATLPRLQGFIRKYKAVAIPIVLIALGIFILLDSGLIL